MLSPLGNKEVRFFVPSEFNRAVKMFGGLEEAQQAYLDLFPRILPSSGASEQAITGEGSPMYLVRKSPPLLHSRHLANHKSSHQTCSVTQRAPG
jgi:hypothetical protein